MKKDQDYYAVLGLEKQATEAEIKAAYRKLVKRYHPDINRSDPGAAAKMKSVNDAYAVLSNKKKKAEYDKNGGVNTGSGTQDQPVYSGTGFDDLFADAFGSGYANYHKRAKSKNPDRNYQTDENDHQTSTGNRQCIRCGGSGFERIVTQSGFGKTTKTRTCSLCRGSGKS